MFNLTRTPLFVVLISSAIFYTQNLHAQQNQPQTTLTITDSQNGKATIIDTTFIGDDIDAVLQKMGYDEASLQKSKQTNIKRTVSIDVKQQVTQKNSTITTAKPNEMNDQKILQITKSAPNATIETLPDGSKKITTTTTQNGNVKVEEKIIKINTKTSPEYTPLDKKAKTEIQIQPPTFSPPANTPKNEKNYVFEQKTTDLQHPQPTVNITIASPDMFDASTINQKDPDLLNAKTLEIKDFMITPNYEQGYYSFKFKLPQPPQNTWLRLYDIVGTEIYAEYFQNASGNFEQMLPDFNLYKKGTFLVLITQENKKYLQKIILE